MQLGILENSHSYVFYNSKHFQLWLKLNNRCTINKKNVIFCLAFTRVYIIIISFIYFFFSNCGPILYVFIILVSQKIKNIQQPIKLVLDRTCFFSGVTVLIRFKPAVSTARASAWIKCLTKMVPFLIKVKYMQIDFVI